MVVGFVGLGFLDVEDVGFVRAGSIGKGFKCSVIEEMCFGKRIQVIFGKESFLVQRQYLELKKSFKRKPRWVFACF